ncbi:LysO family transporter [Filifactor villosus]|uniref:LysO family transporter n=1 Tax=Filifactor villosus TaxID=29374 RepID=A0ABV9QI40_9FIRM
MGFKILMYIGIMAVGVLFARSGKIHKKIFEEMEKIQLVCLLFLLFVMGCSVGANKEVMRSFPSLGLKSVAVSVFTISFSILFVFVFNRLFQLGKSER